MVKLHALLQGHTEQVDGMSFSTDGKTLATCSRDKSARLWAVETGKQTAVFPTASISTYAVAFSPDGKQVAASDDRLVRLWDVNTGQEKASLIGHTDYLTSLAYSRDGKLLASADAVGKIRLWDPKTGQEIAVLTGHGTTIQRIAFSPDGATLAAADYSATTLLWDIKTRRRVHQIREPVPPSVNPGSMRVMSLAFTRDGQTLITATLDGRVNSCNLQTMVTRRMFSGCYAALHPDGALLAAVQCGDDSVTLYDLSKSGKAMPLAEAGRDVLEVLFSPDGEYLATAHQDGMARLWTLSSDTKPGSPSSDPTALTIDLGGGVKMEFVLIPAGLFMMGGDMGSDEKPVRVVAISKPFYLGKYEVIQEQWEAVMGSNPSRFIDPKNPVEYVSWDDCQVFLRELKKKAPAYEYALPTEAQWEYACRAGTSTTYSFGDSESSLAEYAWFSGNSGGTTHLIGLKKPNPWGLYDIHGNVLEWCADFYAASYPSSAESDPTGPSWGVTRVLRGGRDCRSAYRWHDVPSARHVKDPSRRDSEYGFRVAVVAW
jgi:WD40 repeat protein